MSGLTRTEICAVRPLRRRDLRQQIEFGLGLDIDAENAFVDRQRQFAVRLAEAGEHDLVGGIPASRARFSSPPDTTSAPAPNLASVLMTA